MFNYFEKNISDQKIGMIFHPPNLLTIDNAINELYPAFSPFYLKLNNLIKKNILLKLPPFRYFKVNIVSEIGKSSEIVGIMLPLLPEHFLTLRKELVLEKILNSIELARKRGVKLITLGAFTSIVTDQGEDLIDVSSINFTSGNTYTASLCVQSILKLIKRLDLSISDLTIGIVGATGNIGSACAKFFSNKAKKILLNSRKISHDSKLIQELDDYCQYEIIDDSQNLIKRSDIVICATNSIVPLFDCHDFKSGSIVCDISMPPTIARGVLKKRKDVFAYEGGRGKIFNFERINNKRWRNLFPINSIYGCLLESLILSFEGRFENFSIGKKMISEKSMDEIYQLGLKHGVMISDFNCEGYFYNEEDFKKIEILIKRNLS